MSASEASRGTLQRRAAPAPLRAVASPRASTRAHSPTGSGSALAASRDERWPLSSSQSVAAPPRVASRPASASSRGGTPRRGPAAQEFLVGSRPAKYVSASYARVVAADADRKKRARDPRAAAGPRPYATILPSSAEARKVARIQQVKEAERKVYQRARANVPVAASRAPSSLRTQVSLPYTATDACAGGGVGVVADDSWGRAPPPLGSRGSPEAAASNRPVARSASGTSAGGDAGRTSRSVASESPQPAGVGSALASPSNRDVALRSCATDTIATGGSIANRSPLLPRGLGASAASLGLAPWSLPTSGRRLSEDATASVFRDEPTERRQSDKSSSSTERPPDGGSGTSGTAESGGLWVGVNGGVDGAMLMLPTPTDGVYARGWSGQGSASALSLSQPVSADAVGSMALSCDEERNGAKGAAAGPPSRAVSPGSDAASGAALDTNTTATPTDTAAAALPTVAAAAAARSRAARQPARHAAPSAAGATGAARAGSRASSAGSRSAAPRPEAAVAVPAFRAVAKRCFADAVTTISGATVSYLVNATAAKYAPLPPPPTNFQKKAPLPAAVLRRMAPPASVAAAAADAAQLRGQRPLSAPAWQRRVTAPSETATAAGDNAPSGPQPGPPMTTKNGPRLAARTATPSDASAAAITAAERRARAHAYGVRAGTAAGSRAQRPAPRARTPTAPTAATRATAAAAATTPALAASMPRSSSGSPPQ